MTSKEQEAADRLLAERVKVYGDRVDNMERTALIWSGLLGHEVLPEQVPMMMAAYKAFRFMRTPDYSDNIDDIDGWVRMAREIVGERMIQARTVEEYLEKKEARDTVHVRTATNNPERQQEEEMMAAYHRLYNPTRPKFDDSLPEGTPKGKAPIWYFIQAILVNSARVHGVPVPSPKILDEVTEEWMKSWLRGTYLKGVQ